MHEKSFEKRISTGISGFDELLYGGLIPHHGYLVRGEAGVGKTILGLHFLTAGVKSGEQVLYISLQESENSLRNNAERVGIDTSDINFLDLSTPSEFFTKVESYQLFTPGQVDSQPITKCIIETVTRLKPTRVFVDPITLFRYLSVDVFHFRKQVISFLAFLIEQGATVLISSEISRDTPDDDLKVCVDGIFKLEHLCEQRTVQIEKMRGTDFVDKTNSLKITNKGMIVFPHLLPTLRERREIILNKIVTGVPGIDDLLKGGFAQGSTTLISGPSGVGKTTIGSLFIKTAALNNDRAVIFSFEVNTTLIIRRLEELGLDAATLIEKRKLSIRKVEAFGFSPDEFTQVIRHEVEVNNTRIILLDSVTGFNVALGTDHLVYRLHEIGTYLQSMGVVLIIIAETTNIVESLQVSDIGISYFVDNIVFLRYIEINGELRKVIGVLKKRFSDFEKTLREFEITSDGVKVGQPLHNLRGVITGIPEFLE